MQCNQNPEMPCTNIDFNKCKICENPDLCLCTKRKTKPDAIEDQSQAHGEGRLKK